MFSRLPDPPRVMLPALGYGRVKDCPVSPKLTWFSFTAEAKHIFLHNALYGNRVRFWIGDEVDVPPDDTLYGYFLSAGSSTWLDGYIMRMTGMTGISAATTENGAATLRVSWLPR